MERSSFSGKPARGIAIRESNRWRRAESRPSKDEREGSGGFCRCLAAEKKVRREKGKQGKRKFLVRERGGGF